MNHPPRFTLLPDTPSTSTPTLGPLYRIVVDSRYTLFSRLMRDDAEWLASVLNGYANNVKPSTPSMPLVKLGPGGAYTTEIAA